MLNKYTKSIASWPRVAFVTCGLTAGLLLLTVACAPAEKASNAPIPVTDVKQSDQKQLVDMTAPPLPPADRDTSPADIAVLEQFLDDEADPELDALITRAAESKTKQ